MQIKYKRRSWKFHSRIKSHFTTLERAAPCQDLFYWESRKSEGILHLCKKFQDLPSPIWQPKSSQQNWNVDWQGPPSFETQIKTLFKKWKELRLANTSAEMWSFPHSRINRPFVKAILPLNEKLLWTLTVDWKTLKLYQYFVNNVYLQNLCPFFTIFQWK